MSWLEKVKPNKVDANSKSTSVPEGLWLSCPGCSAMLYKPEVETNLNVCSKCDHHMRIPARTRLKHFFDADSAVIAIAEKVESTDILNFKDTQKYKERLRVAREKTGERNALIVQQGTVKGMDMVVAAFEFSFLGGSMSAAVGEAFVQAVNVALEKKLPFVCFTASGGARMQEALVSLMQMAKTSAALAKLAEAKLPYISVLTDPTTGGVSASLAMLGDVNLAEPGALIGFAGPRVIKDFLKTDLPEGFQRSEFLLNHGALDKVVNRLALRDTIVSIVAMLMNVKKDNVISAA